MLRYSVTFVLLAIIYGQVIALQDYCNLKSCEGLGPHTSCLYKSPEPAPQCGSVLDVGLSSNEQRKIVDLHNELRQKVANGQEIGGSPGPQPRALDMNYLTWDDELAEIAQRWANQCQRGHDSCRDVDRFPVGQNLGFSWTTGDIEDYEVEKFVQAWFDEVKDFDSNDVREFKNTGRMIGHYTQLVWAKTTKVGCGAIKHKIGDESHLTLACNYGPAGNWIGEPVYET